MGGYQYKDNLFIRLKMSEASDINIDYNAYIKDIQRRDLLSIIDSDIGHQEKKSVKMKLLILQSTVKCLIENGYSKTSTQLVSKIAGVSRGALLYHYKNRNALIEATLDYILNRRANEYYTRTTALSEHERKVEGKAIEIYWEISRTDECQALLEISMAARTDEALQDIYLPRIKARNYIALNVISHIFPEWNTVDTKNLQKAMDLIDAFIIGLNVQRDVLETQNRRSALRKFAFDAIQKLRES